jgi:sugar phosphate isomerase/epimerase
LDSHNLATANQHFDLVRKVPVSRIGLAQIAGILSTKRERALPGEGSTDIAYFVNALAAMDYTGAVSIELFPSHPWEDPGRFASIAYARVRDLIDAATTPTWG